VYLGVDTGGTFTDVVLFDPPTQRLFSHKVSSTPNDPALAVFKAVEQLLQRAVGEPSHVEHLVHGTTVATNAALQGRWAKTALVTTQGFRDVLEIGRQDRPELFNFFTQRPAPLVPRDLRFEVPERLDYRGRILRPLDLGAAAKLAERLRQLEVESVAVVLLFSYVNPVHELKLKALLERALDVPVVLSYHTLPEFREYERTSTTALNAALVPVVSDYLKVLDGGAQTLGIKRPWRIMQSNAGTTNASGARSLPITLLLSGPAGGVEGARFVGQQTGYPNLITLDMGGTSCDVSLVRGGIPTLTSEGRVAGHPVRAAMVDIHTLGAGGGSVAWVDAGGGLRLGPKSAGAQPGPACYGRGGRQATLSDAQLVLGRLNPQAPLGDLTGLDAEAARACILERVAEPLDVSLEDAAWGIVAVANAQMERAIRLISVERGHDPRQCALLAFGGAGPLHAPELAERLRMPTVIVPHAAGVLSAFGLLGADVKHAFVKTDLQRQGAFDWERINRTYDGFRAEAGRRLRQDGVEPQRTTFRPSMDLRYRGQSFELELFVPERALAAEDFADIAARFHREHLRAYGHADPQEPLELVSVRLQALGALSKPNFLPQPPAKGVPSPAGRRRVYFEAVGWCDCPYYARENVSYPAQLEGPAVVEGADATVVLPPAWRLRVERYGHALLQKI